MEAGHFPHPKGGPGGGVMEEYTLWRQLSRRLGFGKKDVGVKNTDRVRVVTQIGALEITARVVHRSELLHGVKGSLCDWKRWRKILRHFIGPLLHVRGTYPTLEKASAFLLGHRNTETLVK